MTRGSGNDVLKETWAGGQALMPSLGGSFARWCYRLLGGIQPDPEGPGFRRIIIRPTMVHDVQWVNCHHDSPYGRITSNWRRQNQSLVMDVAIPFGLALARHPAYSAAVPNYPEYENTRLARTGALSTGAGQTGNPPEGLVCSAARFSCNAGSGLGPSGPAASPC
jgi:hypothetical protein